MSPRGLLATFREFLPLPEDVPAVTLGEGETPLVAAPALRERLGSLAAGGRGSRTAVYLKLEGCNPTGSFKDRGMAVAVTRARARGARALICASTGNTAASAAAYAARAGLACHLVLPAGGVAAGKLGQALACGARVHLVDGNFDAALDVVRAVAEARPDVELVNSLNPYRLEGQKTAAFEVVEQLRADGAGEPAALFLPVGNGGNVTAYGMGFEQWLRAGRLGRAPRLFGVQAEGAAAVALGRPVAEPRTVASAIRIGRPAYGERAREAVARSGGRLLTVSDGEILEVQRLLAREEGVFAEPASAASVAGLLKAAAAGLVPDDGPVVCVLTGHGLKDLDTPLGTWASAQLGEPQPPAGVLERLLAGEGSA